MNCRPDQLPDFQIATNGIISEAFLLQGITTLHNAIDFIRNLKYGRNTDKSDLRTVFRDKKGTCSTKHALMKCLADENGPNPIRLMLGIFRMHAVNTPKISSTLLRYGLAYIPEAHIYLKYRAAVFDFTSPQPSDFISDLLYETVIQPGDIIHYKVQLHQYFLTDWLSQNKDITYAPDALWRIREQCIRDLSG